MRRKSVIFILFSLLIVFLSSCSSIEETSVNVLADLLNKGSFHLEEEENWDNFRQTVPAQLKLLETIQVVYPKNQVILSLLVKGHSSYAFVVPETLYFEEELQHKGRGQLLLESNHRENAKYHYKQSLKYAFHYLKNIGLEFEELKNLLKSDNVNEIEKSLSPYVSVNSQNDRDVLFYFSLSWLNHFNLDKTQIFLLGFIGPVEKLMEWSCRHDPEQYRGACLVFKGIKWSQLPPYLKGNEKEEDYFQTSIEKYPENLFNYYSYLLHEIVPKILSDEESKKKTDTNLIKELNQFDTKISAYSREKTVFNSNKVKEWLKSNKNREELLNTLAVKRWGILKKYIKSLKNISI